MCILIYVDLHLVTGEYICYSKVKFIKWNHQALQKTVLNMRPIGLKVVIDHDMEQN